MNKRIQAFLTMFLLSIVLATSALASVKIDGVYYELYKKSTPFAKVVKGDGYAGKIVIPNTVTYEGVEYKVTSFAADAFSSNYDITSLVIGDNVTAIEANSFTFCRSLYSVTLGKSLVSIGDKAFCWCSGLAVVKFSDSVTSIGTDAFRDCTSLTSVTIPNKVTSIAEYTFNGCSSLKSVTFPTTLETIGNYSFQGCTALESIIIPNSVTSIGNQAFAGCTKLAGVTLGESLGKLESGAFSNCNDLTNVYCYAATPPSIGWGDPFESSYPDQVNLYVPKSSLELYQKNDYWKKFGFIKAIEGGDGEQQCDIPTITYIDGKLKFRSTTNGAKFMYKITVEDATSSSLLSEGGEVDLTACYDIECYATAPGYKQSSVATAKLYWVKANGNLENTTDNINLAKTRGIVATSQDGIVTLSGLDNGEEVRFYSIDGKQIGAVKAIGGVASQAVSSSSIVIAKLGGQSIKIAVK